MKTFLKLVVLSVLAVTALAVGDLVLKVDVADLAGPLNSPTDLEFRQKWQAWEEKLQQASTSEEKERLQEEGRRLLHEQVIAASRKR